MFRRFRESPYFKAGLMILVCGGILIMFHNWVRNTHFSVGFETLSKTMAPVLIGVIFAFILCPVYNACVKYGYHKMLEGAGIARENDAVFMALSYHFHPEMCQCKKC